MDTTSCALGQGTILTASVILTVNVTFGNYAMINRACNVGHEAVVGAGVLINPFASISGGVVIGDRSLIGTSATVLQYFKVGYDATVGAGAEVTRDVPPGTTVISIPVRSQTA